MKTPKEHFDRPLAAACVLSDFAGDVSFSIGSVDFFLGFDFVLRPLLSSDDSRISSDFSGLTLFFLGFFGGTSAERWS